MIRTLKSKEIELMRQSGKILAGVFDVLQPEIKPGVSTKHLDKIAHQYIIASGAKPSCLHYCGFPASICTSIDDVIVHGIPREDDILKEGQIIGVDVCVCYKGFHTDAARTFAVGKISETKQKLIDVTRQSFYEGIRGLKAGARVGDIGSKVQTYAEKFGFSVVRELVGHGVGHSLHEDPSIPNYGTAGLGAKLPANATVAIEPMINAGKKDVVFNGMWDVRTRDGEPSAHYENTVLITEDGVEVLTSREDCNVK